MSAIATSEAQLDDYIKKKRITLIQEERDTALRYYESTKLGAIWNYTLESVVEILGGRIEMIKHEKRNRCSRWCNVCHNFINNEGNTFMKHCASEPSEKNRDQNAL